MKKRVLKKKIVQYNKDYISTILSLVEFKITKKKYFSKYANNSICWFWLKEFPLWKFGVTIYEDGSYDIFGEHEYMIDKFRAYHTYISFEQQKPIIKEFCGKEYLVISIEEFNQELKTLLNKDEKHIEYLNEINEVKIYLDRLNEYNQKQYDSMSAFIKEFNKKNEIQLKLQHVNGNCIQHREINVSSKLQNLELLSKDQICCVYEQLSNAKYFNLEQSNDLRYDDYILVIGDYWRDLIFKDYIYTQKEFEYLKKLYSWKENTLKERLRFNY